MLPRLAAALVVVCFAMPAAAALSLVWSDEFNGTSLNTADWNIDVGDGCPSLCGWGNNELEYYRPENVTVTGGNLVLTAKQEWYGGRAFTSGKVHTRDKRSFLYGRMEMRAKIPSGDGMWPAFWMMPQDDAYGGWASSGEIDIMESVNTATTIHGTIHYGGSWPDNVHSGGTYAPGGDFGDDFHIYAVEWEPDAIRWYVDGVHFATRYSWQWHTNAAPENDRAPFDQPFYLILNFAVGGNFPGCIEQSCITNDLPKEYVIDYVRVYQETSNIMPVVEITSPDEGDNPPAGNVMITATASDADGSVTGVEFYHGTTLLGADLFAPYSIVWSSVADGCYTVTARALDDAGGEGFDSVDLTVGAGCGQAAYAGPPTALPARIQAEDFDVGGEGVAYHDGTSANSGGQYRPGEGVDIENCSDGGGGYNVGWVAADEWLEFTVDVPVPGEYPIDVRVASLQQGGAFRLEVAGADVTGDVVFGATGGWQTWTTVSTSAVFAPGVQVIRFVIVDGEFNTNWIDIQATTTGVGSDLPETGLLLHPCYPNPFNPSTTIAYELTAPAMVGLTVHDVAGRVVRTLVGAAVEPAGRHEVVWRGRDDAGRAVAAGVYFGRLVAGGKTEMIRLALVK